MLYTINFEYRGGTYLAQIEAAGPREAVARWLEQISAEELQAWIADRAAMEEAFAEEVPIAIRGLRNVWCVTRTLNGDLALANIVATATTS